MHLLPPPSFLLLYAFFLSLPSPCMCVYGGPGEKRDGGGGWGERGVGMREKHSIRKNDEGGYAGKKRRKRYFSKICLCIAGKT